MNDYDSEILYHHRKANVVVDALICKEISAPIRALCLRMTIVTPLLEQIREAWVKAIKEEYWKSE